MNNIDPFKTNDAFLNISNPQILGTTFSPGADTASELKQSSGIHNELDFQKNQPSFYPTNNATLQSQMPPPNLPHQLPYQSMPNHNSQLGMIPAPLLFQPPPLGGVYPYQYPLANSPSYYLVQPIGADISGGVMNSQQLYPRQMYTPLGYPQQQPVPFQHQGQPMQPLIPQQQMFMDPRIRRKSREEVSMSDAESDNTQEDVILSLTNPEQIKTAYVNLKKKFDEIKEEIAEERGEYEGNLKDKEVENSCLKAIITNMTKAKQEGEENIGVLRDKINALELEKRRLESARLSMIQQILILQKLIDMNCPTLRNSAEASSLAETQLTNSYTLVSHEEAKILEQMITEVSSKLRQALFKVGDGGA